MPPVNPLLLPCLSMLRVQVNAIAPERNKASDGWIGDARHQKLGSRSGHNPRKLAGTSRFYVSALDITNDPDNDMSGEMLSLSLRVGRDRRLLYMIWNERIMWGNDSIRPWQWQPYKYADEYPHKDHVHVSAVFDLTGIPGIQWFMPAWGAFRTRPRTEFGARGLIVGIIQALTGVPIDNAFGPRTKDAVKGFQHAHELADDGIVGPHTWEALHSSMLRVPAQH